MIDRIKDFASHFFVTGDPLIYGADVSIGLTTHGHSVCPTFISKSGAGSGVNG